MSSEKRTNLISISDAKWKLRGCKHMELIVDEMQELIECGDCGDKLNPIWVLMRFAREESQWERNYTALKEKEKLLENKVRTKCIHCKKMTPVKTKGVRP